MRMRVLLDLGGFRVRAVEVQRTLRIICVDGMAWRLVGFVTEQPDPDQAAARTLPRYVPLNRSRKIADVGEQPTIDRKQSHQPGDQG